MWIFLQAMEDAENLSRRDTACTQESLSCRMPIGPSNKLLINYSNRADFLDGIKNTPVNTYEKLGEDKAYWLTKTTLSSAVAFINEFKKCESPEELKALVSKRGGPKENKFRCFVLACINHEHVLNALATQTLTVHPTNPFIRILGDGENKRYISDYGQVEFKQIEEGLESFLAKMWPEENEEVREEASSKEPAISSETKEEKEADGMQPEEETQPTADKEPITQPVSEDEKSDTEKDDRTAQASDPLLEYQDDQSRDGKPETEATEVDTKELIVQPVPEDEHSDNEDKKETEAEAVGSTLTE